MACGPVNLFSIYFAKHVGMSTSGYGHCLSLTYLISLLLAYPVGVLADRIHPLRATIITLALLGMATLWGGIYATDGRNFGIAFVAFGVLSGTFMTAVASLSQRILPRAKYAELASANGIVINIMGISLAPLVGIFLDHVGHIYRYTFFITSGLAFTAFLLSLVIWKKFQALGGTKNYVAP